jgi:hypothetical protein
MAELSRIQQIKLEKLFQMQDGYVLQFSNKTFADFIFEYLQIDIYSEYYADLGESKANRLRTFWKKESINRVGTLNKKLIEKWKENKNQQYAKISDEEELLYNECIEIANKLLESNIVEGIEVIKEISDDRDFSLLATSIKESIAKNEPEVALDRLHTYLIKFIRKLCENHLIDFKKEESLNAIYGKYINFINSKGMIESPMAEKILKYSINIIEAFNDIRNNRSLAHDNPILNYSESILIFNNIINAIRFIENIENKTKKEIENCNLEDLPF